MSDIVRTTVGASAPLLSINQSNTQNLGLLPRFLRLSFFPFTAFSEDRGSLIERRIVNFFRKQIAGVSCCSSRADYDPQRLVRSKLHLEELGGRPFSLRTVDGEGELHAMFFNCGDVKRKIQAMGGDWRKICYEEKYYFVITPPTSPSDDWDMFYRDILKRMDWKPASWDANILITAHVEKDTFEIEHPARAVKCVLIVNSTMPYAMSPKLIGNHVGHGNNVLVYNGRGLPAIPGISTGRGVPSELATYADAETMVQHLLLKSFEMRNIWLTGACLDTAIIMEVVVKHAGEGIHALIETPPTSISSMIQTSRFATWFLRRYYGAIQAPNKSPLRQVFPQEAEDCFNVLSKIGRLNPGGESSVLVAATVGDLAVPVVVVKEVHQAFKGKMRAEFVLHDPREVIPEGTHFDPHLVSPCRNPAVLRELDRMLFQ